MTEATPAEARAKLFRAIKRAEGEVRGGMPIHEALTPLKPFWVKYVYSITMMAAEIADGIVNPEQQERE